MTFSYLFVLLSQQFDAFEVNCLPVNVTIGAGGFYLSVQTVGCCCDYLVFGLVDDECQMAVFPAPLRCFDHACRYCDLVF